LKLVSDSCGERASPRLRFGFEETSRFFILDAAQTELPDMPRRDRASRCFALPDVQVAT